MIQIASYLNQASQNYFRLLKKLPQKDKNYTWWMGEIDNVKIQIVENIYEDSRDRRKTQKEYSVVIDGKDYTFDSKDQVNRKLTELISKAKTKIEYNPNLFSKPNAYPESDSQWKTFTKTKWNELAKLDKKQLENVISSARRDLRSADPKIEEEAGVTIDIAKLLIKNQNKTANIVTDQYLKATTEEMKFTHKINDSTGEAWVYLNGKQVWHTDISDTIKNLNPYQKSLALYEAVTGNLGVIGKIRRVPENKMKSYSVRGTEVLTPKDYKKYKDSYK